MVILKTVLSILAVGAGTIHLAMVPGSPLPLGVVFLLLGGSEIVWAIYNLSSEKIAYPKLILGVAVAGMLIWVGSYAFPWERWVGNKYSPSELPAAASSLLNFCLSLGVALHIRKNRDRTGPVETKPVSTPKLLLTVVASALLVSAITTPALAATEAGHHAKPHGEFHIPEHTRH